MRTFVIGDIHGAHRALVQCLERSQFDYSKDHLICVGDGCDGWPETREAIDELLKIKNLVYILGNHDYYTLEWMKYGIADEIWLSQGGKATVQSYGNTTDRMHQTFLENALPYYVLDNKFFVHAGIDPQQPIAQQGIDIFLWDRNLARLALHYHDRAIESPLTDYDEVYVGHTPISYRQPVCGGGVWLMDTGAGWSGPLSMMDVHKKEVFQSDNVPSLYPGQRGRR